MDITSYGPDLPGAPRLGHDGARGCWTLVPELPRLRLSSLDPAAIDPTISGSVLAEEPRLLPHLHLSLQAGRRHGAQAHEAVATAGQGPRWPPSPARASLRPGIAIGADLIAGFPTETEAQAANTLEFVARARRSPICTSSPYSERPGTPAARMPAVPPALRRERAARLRAAAAGHAARFHQAQLGRTVRVLAERGGRGHSEHFAPVRLDAPAGSLVDARVVAADAHGLVAAQVARV